MPARRRQRVLAGIHSLPLRAGGSGQLTCWVAEPVKSFSLAGSAESLDDFRYGPALIFSRQEPQVGKPRAVFGT